MKIVSSPRIRSLAALLGAVGVIFLAASDPTKSASIARDDLEDMFIPRASWLGESIRAGRFPAWNPDVGCGIDQYATLQGAVWYPPMWLHAILPLPASLGLLAYGHLLLAAGGVYCWLRGLNIGRAAALLAGIAMAFGAVGESRWPTMLYSLAWIPWQFCIIDRHGPFTLRRWLLLTLAFAFQFATAYPQFIVYGVIAIGLYGSAKAIIHKSPRVAFAAPTAAAFGALLLSVQLWPTLNYMRNECWRQGAVTPAEAHYLGGASPDPLTLQWSRILPKTIENSCKVRQLSNRFSYGYLGAAMPIAALVALLWCRDWRIYFFGLLAVVGLFLAGGYSRGSEPIYALFAKLPLVGGFRSPDRLMLWYLLGCCVLLGIGANRLCETVLSRKAAIGVVFILGIFAAIRIGLAAVMGSLFPNGLIWFLAIGVLAFVAIQKIPAAKKNQPNWLVAAFLAFSLLDLWFASAYVCPYFNFPVSWLDTIQTRERALLRNEEIAGLAARAGHERIYVAGPYRQVMRTSYMAQFRTLPMYESLMPTRHYQLSNAVFPAEQPGYRHFTFWNIPPTLHQRIFDWCSVRYLHATKPIEEAEANGWKLVNSWSDAGGGLLYENKNCVPRASLRSRFVVAPADQILAKMCQPASDGEQDAIFLETSPENLQKEMSHSADSMSADEVKWLLDKPGHLKLEVTCSRPALLLITESYSPGWTATINNSISPILRANYLHQAVEVPAGKHVVELIFGTPGLRIGVGVSLAGVTLFGILLTVASRHPAISKAKIEIDR